MRGRAEALVCVYSGAAAGVARDVRCLPQRTDLERVCQQACTSHLVVSSPVTGPVDHTRVEE